MNYNNIKYKINNNVINISYNIIKISIKYLA